MMNKNRDINDLYLMVQLLKDFEMPISPILEYAIKEKEEKLLQMGEVQNQNAIEDAFTPKRNVNSNVNYSTLSVRKEDGTLIEGQTAAMVLCNTIKAIGIEKVRVLNISLDGMNLVSLGGNKLYPSAQYDLGNGYFVNTHSSNVAKKRQIERMINAYNLRWEVEIIKP